MISDAIIQRGGSKLEITRLLIESGLDIPIPNSAWLYYGQDISSLRESFNDMKKPVIVRGSHPNDYHGFIDVVPTHRDIETFDELTDAIMDIYKTMKEDSIRIHAKDWGQPYSPETHILLQEQETDIVGIMLRHPHTEKLMIQYYEFSNREETGWSREVVSDATTHKNGNMSHTCHIRKNRRKVVSDDHIMDLIGMYEQLEKSGIFDSSFSYQVEFGLNPLRFFQARPFKKYEPKVDFDYPDFFDTDIPHITATEYFGITPPQGIEVSFVPADQFELWNPDFAPQSPYGIIMAGKLYSTPKIETKLGDLVAYVSSAEGFNFLAHHEYRQVKRARFSFIDLFALNVEKNGLIYHDKGDFDEFRECRLFSTGNSGVIVPVKYL